MSNNAHLRAEMYLSARMMAQERGDIIERAVDSITKELDAAIRHEIAEGLKELIRIAVKEEIREQVKQAVAARVDEFVEELL